MNKTIKFLMICIAFFITGMLKTQCIAELPESLDISGLWRFDIDNEDKGVQEKWYSKQLPQKIKLPGSMNENGFGDQQKAIPQEFWGKWVDDPTCHPVKRFDYRGSAWYQRDFEVPKEWENKYLRLFLERVCWVSQIWLDDKLIGTQDTLSVPHVYGLGMLTPGQHRLTVRVDNRELYELGENTHAYHEQSLTIYNGIIGELKITAHPVLHVSRIQVYADPDTGNCQLKTIVSNPTNQKAFGKLSTLIRCTNGDTVLATETVECVAEPGESQMNIAIEVPKDKILRWSEFSPVLYTAEVHLTSDTDTEISSARFGFRSLTTKGPQFLLNGNPVLMRGEANNAQFPLTGYPAMMVEQWRSIFKLFKDFGLNHFRCHAWTPPEAAFVAADELGIYMQPELPNGESAILDKKGNKWRRKEFDRIVDTYGNHPSFVLMTMGNEVKLRDYTFLKELVARGKTRDSRHLYATISNPEAGGFRDEHPGDDFAVAHGSRKGRRRMEPYFNRKYPETMGDYRHTMQGRPVPQIAHEIGQWYVYPDITEIDKYNEGALRAVNLEYFRDKLKENDLLHKSRDFVEVSGSLSLLLYKEEIERHLRTPENGGFQLLGLQDSFDQGSAYVGHVNNFFEPKFYVTAEQYRRFCGPIVPLARFVKRVWLNNETFEADIELSQYGPEPIENKKISWTVTSGKILISEGVFNLQILPNSGLVPIGKVSASLAKLSKAAKCTLEVRIEDTAIANDWQFWVYPNELKPIDTDDVLVVDNMNPEVREKLENGARVVLLPHSFKSEYPTAMTSPFWSPIMFQNQKQIVGFLCQNQHPAFSDFPTDKHNNWQWWELTLNSSAIHLEGVDVGYEPLVQGIDHPHRAHQLGIIYEGIVGEGKLLVCTLDLNRDLDKRPVARQLRHSLLKYAASDSFRPTHILDPDKHLPYGGRASVLAKLSPKVRADSEHENQWAFNAVDGNPLTIWHTRWDDTQTPHPHHLTIELKEPIQIRGIIQYPRQDCPNGRIAEYRILVSDNGRDWDEVATGIWKNGQRIQQVRFRPVKTGYIRLEALSEVNGGPCTSLAEIDVITEKYPI